MSQLKDNHTADALWLTGHAGLLARDFWLEKFKLTDQHEIMLWPMANDAGEREEISINLDKTQCSSLSKITRGGEQGLNVVLLSVYLILLYKYKGAVSPVAGISAKWTDDDESSSVNTLVPLITNISGRLTVKELLGFVQEEITNCLRYGNYPLNEIDKLQGNQISRTLCESAFYTTFDRKQIHVRETQIIFAPLKQAEKITLNFSLNKQLPFTVTAFSAHFIFTLNACISNSNIRLSEIILQHPPQTRSKAANVVSEDHVLDFWQLSCTRFPENTAIRMNKKCLSYLQVDKITDKLAAYLLQNFGVKKGDRVIVMLNPSEMLPVSLLAIFKLGAIYVPVDPAYPASRIGYIFSEVKPVAVIGDEMSQWAFIDDLLWLNLREKWEDISMDTPVGFATEPLLKTDLAYIIYTSGTTGVPKGVMVGHDNLANFLAHIKYHIPHNEPFRLPLLASHAFDISIYQIMLPLLCGGMLEILEKKDVTDFEKLKELFSSINAIDTVPALFTEITGMFEPGKPVSDTVKHVFIGGDRVSDKVLHDLRIAFPKAYIIVQYGPTEATIFCTSVCYMPSDSIKLNGSVIGNPINNTDILLVDADGNLVPDGVAGEILISGDCVAKGYWNNQELSEQRFKKNTYGNIFNTGDKARRTINSELEFLGRSDDQVKIRGYRIETGEVVAGLEAYPGIKQAVIAVTEDTAGQKMLIAAYTADGSISEEKIRIFLADRLPIYMIPQSLIRLEELPLTSNGKIDKKSITEEAKRYVTAHNKMVAPVSAMEKKLLVIWKAELMKNEAGITCNFFDLGGHSLKAARIASKIARELKVQVSVQDIFFYPTVQLLANFLETGKRILWEQNIVKVPEQPGYELSDGQRRMWLLSQFKEVSVAYNTPAAFYIRGCLDTAALSEAVKTLVGRHEILRTVFIETDDKPKQKINGLDSVEAYPEIIDLRLVNEPLQEAKAAINEKATILFDLSKGPLFKTSLYHIAEDVHILFFNMHHIICDGWSMEVLVREMLVLYNAFTHQLRNPLPPLKFQFRDFAAWQARVMSDQRMEESKVYWLGKLSGDLPRIDLPMDFKRPPIKNYKGAVRQFELDSTLVNQLDLLARKNDSTLFMAFLSVVNILIYKYTGETDIVLGSPLAGRNNVELENQVGFYVNTIVLRSAISGDDHFTDVLKRVRQTVLEAYEHQFYPFDKLVDDLSIPRDLSRTPVFNILVTLDYESATSSDWLTQGGLEISPFIQDFSTSKYDITFRLTHRGDIVTLTVEYDTALFSAQRIAQISGHLRTLMSAVITDLGKRVGILDYLEPAELNTLLQEYNRPWQPIDKTVNYCTGFKKQVTSDPEKIAVCCEAFAFTYGEIDRMSSVASYRLLNDYGLSPKSKIGVFVNRSSKIIPLLTGIFKSKMIYVPIDPNYPLHRIKYIIEDSGIQHIICSASLLAEFGHLLEGINLIQENKLLQVNGDINYIPQPIHHSDLAYIIYTSGSTGNPKGVMIDHGNLVALMEWAAREFETTPFDTVYAVTSYCFDLSVFEFFFPLYTGKQVTILESGVNIESHLIQEDKRVLLNTVPSLIEVLLKEKVSFEKVKAINMAGEAVPPSFKDKIDYRIIETRNLYGPSEDTTYSTNYRFMDDGLAVPIGKPVDNTTVYILDKDGMLSPPGIKGEIYLAGAGLAQGYLNDPVKTAEKFIQWPVNPSVRLYRTGDFGRWLPDGNIEFAGREDAQVKLNGFRIELGEIETVMGRFDGLKNPVAVLRKGKDGDGFIAAYYTSQNGSPTPDEIRAGLGKLLPAFLIPQYIVLMDKMPLTPNGKLDKNSLPNPVLKNDDIQQKTEPITETEIILYNIWKQLLESSEPDISADFFAMGGNSIKAVSVISQLRKKTGIDIGLGELFRFPTIRSLAAFIDQQEKKVYEPIQPLNKSAGYQLSSSQASLLLLSMMDRKANVAYNMPFLYQLDGSVDKVLLKECLNALISRHEILRTTYSQENGNMLQHVHEKMTLAFRTEKPVNGDKEASLQDAFNLVKKDIEIPFDLSNGPVCRALFIELAENKNLFLFNIHHIACDGWSLKILMDELFLCYRSGSPAKAGEIPLKIQYKDYAAWQNRQMESDDFKAAQTFWGRNLALDIQPLKLRVTAGSSSMHHQQSGTSRFVIDHELLKKLEQVNAESHTTLFMLLKASLDLLLYQYTGSTDLLTGTPVANRQHPDLHNQVGYYLNMLPLRTRLSGKDSFETLLEKVKINIIESFRFQQYPFDKMVSDYRSAGKNRPPLNFDVVIDMVDYYSADKDEYRLTEDLNIKMIDLDDAHHSRFNLTVYLYKKTTYAEVVFEYNQGLYNQLAMDKMTSRYRSVIEEVASGNSLQKKLDDFTAAKSFVTPSISSLQGFKK